MPDGDKLRVRVAENGQVTLPQSVCDRHGWAAGTELELVDEPQGVRLRPAEAMPSVPRTRLEDVAGMLRYNGPPVTLQQMDDAITAEVLARYARGRY